MIFPGALPTYFPRLFEGVSTLFPWFPGTAAPVFLRNSRRALCPPAPPWRPLGRRCVGDGGGGGPRAGAAAWSTAAGGGGGAARRNGERAAWPGSRAGVAHARRGAGAPQIVAGHGRRVRPGRRSGRVASTDLTTAVVDAGHTASVVCYIFVALIGNGI